MYVISVISPVNPSRVSRKLNASYFTSICVFSLSLFVFRLVSDGGALKMKMLNKNENDTACTPSGGYHAQKHTELCLLRMHRKPTRANQKQSETERNEQKTKTTQKPFNLAHVRIRSGSRSRSFSTQRVYVCVRRRNRAVYETRACTVNDGIAQSTAYFPLTNKARLFIHRALCHCVTH